MLHPLKITSLISHLSITDPFPRAGSQRISEYPQDSRISPSSGFADQLPAWHSVLNHPEAVDGSAVQVPGDGDAEPLCLQGGWGRARQDAMHTEDALTKVMHREWNSAVLRAALLAQEPAARLMNSSHLLSSHPGLGGEKHPGATGSGSPRGHFSAHLYQSFLQTSTAVNMT